MLNTVPLTYPQLLILFGIAAGLILIIVFFILQKGILFSRKGSTIVIGDDGKKIKVSKEQAYNFVLFLDALNTKDDINHIDHVVFERQRKVCKEKCQSLFTSLLEKFRILMMKRLTINVHDLLSHRDYLFFSLLSDKLYSVAVAHIMGDIEENGLSNKRDPNKYSLERSDNCISHLESIMNSLFVGITSISKQDYDNEWNKLRHIFHKEFVSIYQSAIQFAIKGSEKKKELQSHLFSKIKEIEGISEAQFHKMFSPVSGEEFLDS